MSWQTHFLPGSTPDGQPVLSILAKRTYSIKNQHVSIAEKQAPFVMEDSYAQPESPLYSEVLHENELIFYKPSTDVIVLGDACAPRGKQAYHLDCEVQAGPLHKVVRVWGQRIAKVKAFGGVRISDPEPYERAPIGYAHSYGGMTRDKNGTIVSFYPNPIGVGFTLKTDIGDADTVKVPSVEDPSSPVHPDSLIVQKFEDWQKCPRPTSLGWTRRNFYPRYTYLGVLPEFLDAAAKNQEEAAHKHPQLGTLDIPRMDFRAYQGASHGLWGQRLAGNEKISLRYLDPDFPQFEFLLPSDKPSIVLDMGEGTLDRPAELDTLVIDKNEDRLSMVWRSSFPYGGIEQLGELKKIEYHAESLTPM